MMNSRGSLELSVIVGAIVLTIMGAGLAGAQVEFGKAEPDPKASLTRDIAFISGQTITFAEPRGLVLVNQELHRPPIWRETTTGLDFDLVNVMDNDDGHQVGYVRMGGKIALVRVAQTGQSTIPTGFYAAKVIRDNQSGKWVTQYADPMYSESVVFRPHRGEVK